MILELSVIGIICSAVYILIFDLYPGGIIVPVYFSMYLYQPQRLMGTVLISILCVFIFRFLSKRMLLFGRRRFVFLIVLSSFLSLALNLLFKSYLIDFAGYQTLGILIPGLLANNIFKQGFVITLLSLFTVSVFVFFAFKLVFLL